MTTYSGPAGFTGFPGGKNPYVPIPEVFFTQLLPEIEDSAELKVTLHIFYLLAKQQGNPRCVSDQDLINDHLLQRSLKRRGDPRPSEERLRIGLEQAVARGTLLKVQLRLAGEGADLFIHWYFFNTARSRKAVIELQGGEMIPAHLLMRDEQPAQPQNQLAVGAEVYASSIGYNNAIRPMHVEIERPNIFVLYEQNIGLLSPMIADELKDAADHYPQDWIEAAFREAVEQNKRKWSYIRAILRRWETEGRQ
ncbi:DnaD domain-containing protein [Dictyobacter arantiisoli]|uniref:Primosomal replication protein N n=1 Tax=Dictyobacter arantiisoli TaxID=2014874 RepID=A0A5A5TF84_9CHLR|nr:DnaD domain protein [Dictyobacter arantiisoli]GCF09875.1 primosomal replication protein N [Dictyobacter arantiisoli]